MPAIFSGFQAHSDFIYLYHFMLGYFKKAPIDAFQLRYRALPVEINK